MKNKQNGFGAIELLLLLVIVGLLALVGWYVYNAQQSDISSGSDQTVQSENVPEVSNSDDLKEAEDFVESKDIDKQLDTGEIESTLDQ